MKKMVNKVEANFFVHATMLLILSAFLLSSCNTGTVEKVKKTVPSKAEMFMAGEVKLLDGPFRRSQDAEAKYLLELDLDRLIAPFRTESGLEPRAKAYPGWETNSLPGVGCSFYLSGILRMYKYTGNEEYLTRMRYILDELDSCQVKSGGLLLGSRGAAEIFKKLETEFYPGFNDWSNGHGEPYYVLEKLFSGLIDAYRIGGQEKALKIAVRLADWLEKHMANLSDEDMDNIMVVEYGGMNWVLSDMYALTGNKKYLEMSKRWHDKKVIVPITEGKDILTGIHANTQFPKMSGLAARYPYTGDTSELFCAKFFWDIVANHRSYVTGGNSESEYFSTADSLGHTFTPYTEENCNEYNMLKLTALLYKIDPDIRYADYIERTMFNHILAAQNPDDSRICYHLPMMGGAERFYHSLFESFACCVCSGMDSYTRHAEYIYAHDDDNLIVNLFVSSEVNWKEKGVKLTQETSFPLEEKTVLKIESDKEPQMGLKIRYPYWLAETMMVKLNGEEQTVTPEAGYFIINRKWKNGDIVELTLPMKLRTEPLPENENVIALFHGPVLLAGVFDSVTARNLTIVHELPAIVSAGNSPDKWLLKTDTPLEYVPAAMKPGAMEVKPLYMALTGPFTVYWDKMTDDGWNKRLRTEAKRKLDLAKLESITYDKVTVGNKESENAHKLSGKSNTGKGNSGILKDITWRKALAGDGFSYEMKVPAGTPATLHCTFMGRDQYEAWNCRIKVDTTTIARLSRLKDDSFPVIPFDYSYHIPDGLITGKRTVTLSFVGRQMPRLMEVRILKK